MVDVQPTTVGTVDSIADLRIVAAVGSPATPVFTTVSVKGYHAAGDGGGGMFRFDSSTSTGVNGGTIIDWTKGTGRWLRIVEGGRNYDFRWFGAKGDFRPVTSKMTIAAGSPTTLTSDAAVFSAADKDKVITVPGAGAAGGILIGTVAAFVSETQITLSVPAATSLAGVSTTITLGADDTAACQATINAAMSAGVGVEFSCGDYLVGPLYGNGSVPPVLPVKELAAVHSFKGQGRQPFLSRLIAKPGAYDPGQAVLTFRNIAGKVISNFAIDANNEAEICGDFAWIGGTAPDIPEAPSCHNEFTDLWGSNALRMGWNLDQAADCKVSAIHYDGGSASVGLSFRLAGGGIWADNIFLSTNAKLLLASQNAGFQNCGFFGGVELTGASTNYVHMDAVHLYPYTPKRKLGKNPFSVTVNPNDPQVDPHVVTVTMRSHGLRNGNFVEISGAEPFAGIPADPTNPDASDDLNTDPTPRTNPPLPTPPQGQPLRPHPKADPFPITWVSEDQFSIRVATPATSSAVGGGDNVSIIGRGYTVFSNLPKVAGVYPSGSRSMVFTACWFNQTGVYGQKYFAGRWMMGARFVGCRFAFNPASKLIPGTDEDADIYFDTGTDVNGEDRWTATGALGSLPLFHFDNCSFGTKIPTSATGKVRVGFNGYMSSIGESVQASFQDSVADNVSAFGNSQLSARTMKAELNNITSSTVNTADCVVLPQTAAGRKVRIWNNSTNPIRIFPPKDSSINAQPLDAPLSGNLAVGQRRTFWAISATKWLTE